MIPFVPFVPIGRKAWDAMPWDHGLYGITAQFDSHTLPPTSFSANGLIVDSHHNRYTLE